MQYKIIVIAHAYLLTGVRGIGKTTTARLIAMSLNCSESKDLILMNHVEIAIPVNLLEMIVIWMLLKWMLQAKQE